MTDTDMTSDILIYNVLHSCEDEFIQKCNLKFIDQSVPAQEDDTIYIAVIDLETKQELFNDTEYRALVNIYVKTKDTDYISGSRFLRTVIKHIKTVLRNDEECKSRKIVFRNTTYEYGSKYTLKGMHLIVQLLEYESKSSDVEFECVNLNDDFDIEIQ
jgi:hypothetical protein